MKEKLIAVLTDALQGCVDELELHEKMAFENDDADLIDRLNVAREALKEANAYYEKIKA